MLCPTSFGDRILPSMNCPDRENSDDDQDMAPVRPELDKRQADRQHAADYGADIGNETQKPGHDANGQPELKLPPATGP